MGVRETLDNIENMVATAKTFPFTGHILINDNDLVTTWRSCATTCRRSSRRQMPS